MQEVHETVTKSKFFKRTCGNSDLNQILQREERNGKYCTTKQHYETIIHSKKEMKNQLLIIVWASSCSRRHQRARVHRCSAQPPGGEIVHKTPTIKAVKHKRRPSKASKILWNTENRSLGVDITFPPQSVCFF